MAIVSAGQVAFADFLTLSDNFGSIDAVWEDGDLDCNGQVEFADFQILSANFGHNRPTAEALSPANTATATAVDQLFLQSSG